MVKDQVPAGGVTKMSQAKQTILSSMRHAKVSSLSDGSLTATEPPGQPDQQPELQHTDRLEEQQNSQSSGPQKGQLDSEMYEDWEQEYYDQELGKPDEEIDAAPRISDKQRKQNLIADEYMAKMLLAEATRDASQENPETEGQETNDDLNSIRTIMAKQQSNAIISHPREYQLELFEKSKKENVIAVLDTGSGKTLIAVLLLKHYLDLELESRAQGNLRRLSFFLVDSVALVFQQFAVLECNLNQPIERFYGDMKVDLFNKETWAKHFEENMIIVCTAQVLLDCLLNSFITMAQINLLIFDEAHHTKKNHPYAKIIKDFYVPEPLESRPKIFGMTASPVDSKVDPAEAAFKLETLLHCNIATASDLGLLRHSVNRPKESILDYAMLAKPYKTDLCQQLHTKFGKVQIFQKLFSHAERVASDLGEWAADYLWKISLADEGSERLQRKTEHAFTTKEVTQEMAVLDRELESIKEATALVHTHSMASPTELVRGISSKVLMLNEVLNEDIFSRPNETRCIVFVSQRNHAQLLATLLRELGNKNIRIGVLMGTRKGEAGLERTSVRQQMLTIARFRKGGVNLLIATSIAEEGLDIPDCNCVIRFDLYRTLIQYIQSRGRARHKNSRFIHMVERGNQAHTEIIREVGKGENLMRQFCNALPEDRLLRGSEHDLEDALVKEKYLPVYKEPSTGAKLTFGSVLGRLERFVAVLPRDDESVPRVVYVITVRGPKFVAEAMLPANSPIRSVMGQPFTRKSLAKRSAAFEACLLLREGCYLDENLLPIYQKQLPAMRNAQVALSSKKQKTYGMRTKPAFWEDNWGFVPSSLYVTIVDLDNADSLGRPFTPLALLTKSPIIGIPSFPLHPRPGATSNVIWKSFDVPMQISDTDLQLLDSFTLAIYRDLFNKHYGTDGSWEKMSYWLAPTYRRPTTFSSSTQPRSVLDWTLLKNIHEGKESKWTKNTPYSDLVDHFWVDKWDGSRRFFSIKIDPGLKATDPVPKGCPTHKFMEDILDYSFSAWPNSRKAGKDTYFKWDREQPVMEVQMVDIMRNFLDEWPANKKEHKITYVCPEPLSRSKIPTTVAVFGFLLPAIIHRLESYLLAQELCEILGLEIHTDLALEALTKDSDNTEEHKVEQIQFQRGMGKNYERLEFIGDAFLKMATSISLYVKNAKDDEFESHVKRMMMICNRNLLNVALELKLFEYIRSKGFDRGFWYPGNLVMIAGRFRPFETKTKLVGSHDLKDKTIADVSEALIGASLLSSRESGNMDMAVKAVTKFVRSDDHDVQKFSDYRNLYRKPAWQVAEASAAQVNLVDQVEKKFGYRFKWPRLLRTAFTHPSHPFSWDRIPSYQRLEFLGDALLDMVCINYLYFKFPDKDPQWLTEHKMAMVSNKFLGALCVRLGFHKHMNHNHVVLQQQIKDYVAEITEAETESDGRRDYWNTTSTSPKCLPDIVEAYLGALFIDSDFDFDKVTEFFHGHIMWFFVDMSIYDTFASNHPATRLSNRLSVELGCMRFRTFTRPVPKRDERSTEKEIICAMVMVHDAVVASVKGESGRYAKERVCRLANDELGGLGRLDFRAKYGCDCP